MAVDRISLLALLIVCIYKYGFVAEVMANRVWLPLLLMLVLAAEGVLGAWAGTRMALHVGSALQGEAGSGLALADCERPRATAVSAAHARHAGAPDAPANDSDCECADDVGCRCLCAFTAYPPTTNLLLLAASPLRVTDTPLPVLELPASKLSRVFRPPIV